MKQACFLLTLLLAFSSCKQDENIEIPKEYSLTFTASALTRATQDGTFESNDAIGVFAYDPLSEKVVATNSKYIYSEGKFIAATSHDDIKIIPGEDLDFYVYSPYNETSNNINQISHTITHQSQKASWVKSDFLTAEYKDPIKGFTIPLDFKHRYSTLEVTAKESNGIVNNASISNIKTSSTFNLLKGSISTSSSTQSLNMYLYSSEGNNKTYRITLPPQNIERTTNRITLSNQDASSITLQGNEDVSLRPGNIHKYNIDYKKTISITPYPAGGTVSGEGEYALGTEHTVKATTNPNYTFMGWYENEIRKSESLNYSFKVVEDRNLVVKYKSYSEWVVSISASPTTIASGGGSSTITATATRNVLINGVVSGTETATPSLSMAPSSGFSFSGKIVSATNNTTASQRTATVTASHGGKTKTVTITQSAGQVTFSDWVVKISANPTTIVSTGGSSTITASATRNKLIGGVVSGTETATPSLSMAPSSGFSFSGKTVTAANNTTESQRRATVTASHGGKTASVTITQSAGQKSESYVFEVTPIEHRFGSEGGSIVITINSIKITTINGGNRQETSVDFSIQNSDSWCQLSKSNLTITCQENKTKVKRECTITVTQSGGKKEPITIGIKQNKPTIIEIE